MTYWLGIDSPAVWEDVKQKSNLQEPRPFSFPAGRRKSVKKIKVGDRIINYMKDEKRFFAVWEVTKEHFIDTHVYAGQEFSECVEVYPLVFVEPREGIRFDEIKDRLKRFQELPNKKNWGGIVRQSATEWPAEDGDTILELLGYDGPSDELHRDFQEIRQKCIDPTVKKQLIDARLGQGLFRTKILAGWDNKCAVTGSDLIRAIRASHLKPWRASTDEERLDAKNGLPLLATLDALFDAGLITFDEQGLIELSAGLAARDQRELDKIGISNSQRLRRPPDDRELRYLAYHRQHIFRRQ